MNRRQFLKSLIAAAILTDIPESDIDIILDRAKNSTDNEFVTYVTFQVNMMINNPTYCARIININEGDDIFFRIIKW